MSLRFRRTPRELSQTYLPPLDWPVSFQISDRFVLDSFWILRPGTNWGNSSSVLFQGYRCCRSRRLCAQRLTNALAGQAPVMQKACGFGHLGRKSGGLKTCISGHFWSLAFVAFSNVAVIGTYWPESSPPPISANRLNAIEPDVVCDR
jgi:hypothetical protein